MQWCQVGAGGPGQTIRTGVRPLEPDLCLTTGLGRGVPGSRRHVLACLGLWDSHLPRSSPTWDWGLPPPGEGVGDWGKPEPWGEPATLPVGRSVCPPARGRGLPGKPPTSPGGGDPKRTLDYPGKLEVGPVEEGAPSPGLWGAEPSPGSRGLGQAAEQSPSCPQSVAQKPPSHGLPWKPPTLPGSMHPRGGRSTPGGWRPGLQGCDPGSKGTGPREWEPPPLRLSWWLASLLRMKTTHTP